MSLPDDDDDDRAPIPWGDYATIILAAIFSLTGIYLMVGPSPFTGVKLPKAPPPAQSRPAPNQEVTVGIGSGSTIHPPKHP
ncbi:MAG: hypothetical protein WDN03_03720 [Rhizomicrobium sp.]